MYLIELKHGWISHKTNKVTGQVQSKWTNAVSSLKQITWKDAFDLFPSVKTIAKIALMVTPMYIESKHMEELMKQPYNIDTIYNKYEDFGNYLDPQPHWTGIWVVNRELAKARLLSYGKYECYPAVALVAHIDGQAKR